MFSRGECADEEATLAVQRLASIAYETKHAATAIVKYALILSAVLLSCLPRSGQPPHLPSPQSVSCRHGTQWEAHEDPRPQMSIGIYRMRRVAQEGAVPLVTIRNGMSRLVYSFAET